MKRWFLAVLIAFGCVCAMTSLSIADVANSHHDMAAYTGSGGDTCYPCHGFKETGGVDAALGRVGTLCYLRCHLGDTGQGGAINLDSAWPEVGIFQADNTLSESVAYAGGETTPLAKYNNGHALTRAAIPAPDLSTGWPATWPYVDQPSIECTSCHDVHTNTYTPFLRANLSDNTTRSNAFCHRCHAVTTDGAARWVDMATTAPNGSHPSEADIANAGTRNTLTRRPRTIGFKDDYADNNAVFRNQSASGASLNSPTVHYNPGGKLGDFGTAGNVGCYTCHATHLPQGLSGFDKLIVSNWKGAYTRNQSDMCVGCHGAAATDGRNPGTTPYFHPANGEAPMTDNTGGQPHYTTTQPVPGFLIAVNVNGIDLGLGGRLICSSCHGDTRPVGVPAGNSGFRGVHNGPSGTMILSPLKPTCNDCHSSTAVNMGTTPNSHHVYGGGSTRGDMYTTWGYPSTVTYNGMDNATISNGLSCDDCHVFNGTAHNWN